MLNNDHSERVPSFFKVSTRIKNSTKPAFIQREPVFYHCSHCGQFFIQPGNNNNEMQHRCCSETMEILHAKNTDTDTPLAKEHRPQMTISGGFESNTLSVCTGMPPHSMTEEHHLAWIYIYTFQGGQFKFLQPGDIPEATFALAEKDAYVYCDRRLCKGSKCKFNCKRGFTAYCWCNQHGLWKLTY
ncbi:desulfoferrodoxin family protein [Escherichia albertii]|nr:desulfoferrodoxin family protein [Escherichia albertii]